MRNMIKEVDEVLAKVKGFNYDGTEPNGFAMVEWTAGCIGSGPRAGICGGGYLSVEYFEYFVGSSMHIEKPYLGGE
ncbi:hypothetical protein AA313_de0209077 [Arthrobotrys entomopaga]|nr:hypothetical protein AA313_de0209077 [Arthrobotrys entomopaga]